ncbi:MAG TPA: hypothetical protein VFI13_02120 [Gemmatimonadales bacterium]|nr:hypothetical protein [Gemmatimonadales bacterium]
MVTPLRTPPALHDRAIEDLSFIRRTMEGAASFTDVPGWGLVVTGLTALGAAAYAHTQVTAVAWLGVWFAEAILGAVLGTTLMLQKMRRRAGEGPVLSVPARKFLLGFWPAILAGAVLTYALADRGGMWLPGSRAPEVLPGLWLLLYGVGVVTAGAFSVRVVPMMGVGFLLLGTIDLLVPGLPGDLLLAIGFGGLQILFGALIIRRHGG